MQISRRVSHRQEHRPLRARALLIALDHVTVTLLRALLPLPAPASERLILQTVTERREGTVPDNAVAKSATDSPDSPRSARHRDPMPGRLGQ